MQANIKLLLLALLLPIAICLAQQRDSYDFIICGGGTTGLALANQLTIDPDINVLVVEAGPNASNTNDSNFNRAAMTWQYATVPQAFADDRVIPLFAGKLVGGSSQINGEVYARPEAASIDTWGRMFLNESSSWTWDILFPFYRSSEGVNRPTMLQAAAGNLINPAYHGFDGLVATSFPADPAPEEYFHAYEEMAVHFGISRIPDSSGGSTHGVSTIPLTLTISDGNEIRESSREAFYLPFTDRQNLELLSDTTCLRIDWESLRNSSNSSQSLLIADGVQVANSQGVIAVVNASREVILSAGSYRSSTILEFSGIGNPGILSQYGIEALVSLPGVGENLQDQTQGNTTFRMRNSTRDLLDDYPPIYPPTRLRTNYITYANYRDILGDDADDVRERVWNVLPSYAQNISSPISEALSPATVLRSLQVQYDLIFRQEVPVVELLAHVDNATGGHLGMQHWNLMPLSRGSVHISGPDPLLDGSHPLIDNNFFLIDYDWDMYVATSRFLRKYFNTSPMSDLVDEEVVPGLDSVPVNASDDVWRDYWIPKFTNEWHPIGSCAMLPQEWGGVVDQDLRVYGTANVRVVDASVIPFGMGGHPTSTLYAIAERMGSLMRAEVTASRMKR